jgi:hypothetical protein
MAITGMTGAVYVSDVNTAPVVFTDEATTPDAACKRYQITSTTKRYWDLDTDVTVEVDGVPITTGFTLERAGGFVVFAAARGELEVVTVSGKYLTVVQAGGFFNWSADGDADDAEATTYASQGWKEFVQTLKGWSGSAEAYWGDTRFFDSLGKVVVVKLFVDSGPSQDCLEGFAIINGDGIEVPVDGLVQETVDFTGSGPLYIRM